MSTSLVYVPCLRPLSTSLVYGPCLRPLSTSLVYVPCLRPLSTSRVYVPCLCPLSTALVWHPNLCTTGPEAKTVGPYAFEVIPILTRMLLTDSSLPVKDTCAWSLGKICETLPQSIIQHPSLMELVKGLLASLDTEPRVASNVCWAFSSLAEAAYESADNADNEEEPQTYILSPCFSTIIDKLMATTDRQDANSNNLRSAAYEAVMEMLKSSPRDCYPIVQSTTITIIDR